jgi:hypothetical protein
MSGPFDPVAARLSGHIRFAQSKQVGASNSKTRGKGTALRSGTAASQADSRCSAIHERYATSRRLFTRRGGLAYAAPPFEAAAGRFSG